MQIPYKYRILNWIKENQIALVTDSEGKRLVVKESDNAKVIQQISDQSISYAKNLKRIIPTFYSSENLLLRPYIQGEIAGDTDKIFGFTTEALEKVNPEILATSLYELNFFAGADFVRTVKLETRDGRWYAKNIAETEEVIKKHFNPVYYDSLYSFFVNNIRLLDTCSNHLVNGDLHPGNIFYNCLMAGESRDFVLSDWDLIHFNNACYDVALLSVWAWRSQAWQEALLKKFFSFYPDKKEEMSASLNICLVYLAAQLLKHIDGFSDSSLTEEQRDSRDKLKDTCLNILNKIVH